MTFLTVKWALFLLFVCLFVISFYFIFHILALEDQLQQAKQHAEQYKSMSEANESALSDLNKVGNKRSFLAHSRKIFKPESFIILFFTWNISGVIFIGEGLALSRSQND